MIGTLLETVGTGIFKEVDAPLFGQQHKGIAPGGAMDRFSYLVGNALLETDLSASALELVLAPSLKFLKSCFFVITGARYGTITLKSADESITPKSIDHASVYQANSGDMLYFTNKSAIGFRTYLCVVEENISNRHLKGKTRDQFGDFYSWIDKERMVRVVEGPEYDYLIDKDLFVRNHWKITNDFSDMGFRLETRGKVPTVEMENMISEAVSDGTIQLTPKGPIVLLRHRQTVGGYPRIFNVISADVDTLAQYSPQQLLRFKKVSINEAQEISRRKSKILAQCKVT